MRKLIAAAFAVFGFIAAIAVLMMLAMTEPQEAPTAGPAAVAGREEE